MKLDYKDVGTVGFTCSTFDLLHAGHITMLEEAKHHCDFLVGIVLTVVACRLLGQADHTMLGRCVGNRLVGNGL